jgi:uncharacterized protein with PIN domain
MKVGKRKALQNSDGTIYIKETPSKDKDIEEKLKILESKGLIRRATKKGKIGLSKPIKIKGKPLSETIIELRKEESRRIEMKSFIDVCPKCNQL